MPRTIWVTGASGFIASHLLRHLAEKTSSKHTIVALSRGEPATDRPYSNWLTLDLTDAYAVKRAAELYPPEQLFHLAGATPPKDDSHLWLDNSSATLQLLTGIKLAGIENLRVLNLGSAAEYRINDTGRYSESSDDGGNSVYGQAKSLQTAIAHQCAAHFEFEVMTGRLFNLTGPGLPSSLIMGRVVQLLRNRQPLSLGRLDSERDFLDVRDAVAALLLLMQHGQANNIYNVSSGHALSIQSVVDIAIRLSGEEPAITKRKDYERSGDFNRSLGLNSKLIKTTSWQQNISIEDSIKDMLNQG